MAKLDETVAILKISRMVKDNEEIPSLDQDMLFSQLEEVIEQLVDDPRALVEIISEHNDGD